MQLVLQHCCVLQPLFKPVNNRICCKSGLMWLVKRARYLFDSFCRNVATQVAGFCCPFRGGSRIFLGGRGCTRLLLYFNTNKPDSFFFCRITVVLENRRSSQRGGGAGAHPCTLPLDPPQLFNRTFTVA